MGLLTGTVQNWLAIQNVIRILVTIYIQNLLPACRPIFKVLTVDREHLMMRENEIRPQLTGT